MEDLSAAIATKNVFISPENGGFREIDFMNIGNNCGKSDVPHLKKLPSTHASH